MGSHNQRLFLFVCLPFSIFLVSDGSLCPFLVLQSPPVPYPDSPLSL